MSGEESRMKFLINGNKIQKVTVTEQAFGWATIEYPPSGIYTCSVRNLYNSFEEAIVELKNAKIRFLKKENNYLKREIHKLKANEANLRNQKIDHILRWL